MKLIDSAVQGDQSPAQQHRERTLNRKSVGASIRWMLNLRKSTLALLALAGITIALVASSQTSSASSGQIAMLSRN